MQNNSKRKYPVKRMDISINMEKTGAHIKRAIKESGYSMREIMEITGITTEQTIYKWYSGKSIPSLETQIILCKLLGLKITELLVIDGELGFFRGCFFEGRLFPEASDKHKKIAPISPGLHAKNPLRRLLNCREKLFLPIQLQVQ